MFEKSFHKRKNSNLNLSKLEKNISGSYNHLNKIETLVTKNTTNKVI